MHLLEPSIRKVESIHCVATKELAGMAVEKINCVGHHITIIFFTHPISNLECGSLL
jgi:hypothetical protein